MQKGTIEMFCLDLMQIQYLKYFRLESLISITDESVGLLKQFCCIHERLEQANMHAMVICFMMAPNLSPTTRQDDHITVLMIQLISG